jgi:hypothetical protein
MMITKIKLQLNHERERERSRQTQSKQPFILFILSDSFYPMNLIYILVKTVIQCIWLSTDEQSYPFHGSISHKASFRPSRDSKRGPTRSQAIVLPTQLNLFMSLSEQWKWKLEYRKKSNKDCRKKTVYFLKIY